MDGFFIFCASYLFVGCFLVAAISFLRKDRPTQVQMVFFGLLVCLLSYGVALVAGLLYFDPRPFVEGHFIPLLAHDSENGFPSDHVLLVSSVAVVISFFDRKSAVLIWIMVLLVAYARVYVGVHHYLDVAGSMVIAVLSSMVVYGLLFKKYLIPFSDKVTARWLLKKT